MNSLTVRSKPLPGESPPEVIADGEDIEINSQSAPSPAQPSLGCSGSLELSDSLEVPAKGDPVRPLGRTTQLVEPSTERAGQHPQNSVLHPQLQNLNERQVEAVLHFEGPILVLAGAGSGKTRVLTRRVAHLVLHHQVPPERILAVTFTNKATEEMRGRLQKILGGHADRLWVATFHSAALKMLRRHAKALGFSSDFVVYDDDDSKAVMKEVLKKADIDEKKYPPQMFLKLIDRAKNALLRPVDLAARATDFIGKLNAEVYDSYQRALAAANAMDFGDLLVFAVVLLREHADVRSLYQRNLQFVLVDEFQDTNQVQYEFIKLITEQHRNLLVVGDDDQSIYGFRGANIHNILNFERDYKDTKVVTLDQNYRSTPPILEAAHAVISKNISRKQKKLWTEAKAGEAITTYVADDEGEEASFVAHEIATLASAGFSYDQCAIFYRTNAQSRALEEALMNAGISYRIFGGLRFYERKEVKDILAYLRLVFNEFDNQAFLRTINNPSRGIGSQTVKGIVDYANAKSSSLLQSAREIAPQNRHINEYVKLIDRFRERARALHLGELIRLVVEETEYGPRLKAMKDPTAQSRLENLLELQAIGRSLELSSEPPLDTLRRFIDRVTLTSGGDMASSTNAEGEGEEGPKPSVSLMTLHLAKGLEFPVVFLTGVEDGLLPHGRSIEEPSGIEEERRLCYVGITRAMKRLYLTRCVTRGMFATGEGFGSSGFFREPSRFVFDIPEGCLVHRDRHFFSGAYGRTIKLEVPERGGFGDDEFGPYAEPDSTNPPGGVEAPTVTASDTASDPVAEEGASSWPQRKERKIRGSNRSGERKRSLDGLLRKADDLDESS